MRPKLLYVANSVADKATATATAVTADAPEAKIKATSTDEPLSGNTAFAATAAQASVDEAKFDAEAPAEALAADATEALSVAAMEATRAKAELETNANQVNTGFHFGEKPFGIPTTVGGKGLIAETEVKAKAGAAKATVRSQLGC